MNESPGTSIEGDNEADIPPALSWRIVILCAMVCLFDGWLLAIDLAATDILAALVIPMFLAMLIVVRFSRRFSPASGIA